MKAIVKITGGLRMTIPKNGNAAFAFQKFAIQRRLKGIAFYESENDIVNEVITIRFIGLRTDFEECAEYINKNL